MTRTAAAASGRLPAASPTAQTTAATPPTRRVAPARTNAAQRLHLPICGVRDRSKDALVEIGRRLSLGQGAEHCKEPFHLLQLVAATVAAPQVEEELHRRLARKGLVEIVLELPAAAAAVVLTARVSGVFVLHDWYLRGWDPAAIPIGAARWFPASQDVGLASLPWGVPVPRSGKGRGAGTTIDATPLRASRGKVSRLSGFFSSYMS